jgi:hypothetical protein
LSSRVIYLHLNDTTYPVKVIARRFGLKFGIVRNAKRR